MLTILINTFHNALCFLGFMLLWKADVTEHWEQGGEALSSPVDFGDLAWGEVQNYKHMRLCGVALDICKGHRSLDGAGIAGLPPELSCHAHSLLPFNHIILGAGADNFTAADVAAYSEIQPR